VTFGALARGTNKIGRGLRGFNLGTSSVYEKCSNNERKSDDDSDEH